MISKEDFFAMSNDDAISYIESRYCIDDMNDACMDFIEEWCEEDDEEDYDEIIYEYNGIFYQYPLDILDPSEIKDFLWETIVGQCEEIEDEED